MVSCVRIFLTGTDSHGVTDATMEALGQHLRHLTSLVADVVPYTITCRGLAAQPAVMKRLELSGIVSCGADELKVRHILFVP
jgi:hypothetical protein